MSTVLPRAATNAVADPKDLPIQIVPIYNFLTSAALLATGSNLWRTRAEEPKE